MSYSESFTLQKVEFTPRLTKKGTGLVGSTSFGMAFINKHHLPKLLADIRWVCVDIIGDGVDESKLYILEPAQKQIMVWAKATVADTPARRPRG